VIDDDVDEHAGTQRMGRLRKLAELVDARGAFVEFHQRGIDRRQIQRRVGAAKASEARVDRGRGVHGQKMEDAAAQSSDDKWQLPREVAEGPGRRQGGVALRFEGLQLGFQFFIGGGGQAFRGAE